MYVCYGVWRMNPDDAPTTPGGVRQIEMPADARALSTLSRIAYEDAFLVDIRAARQRTGEQWARAILDDAPITVRRKLWWSWLALGLRLGSPRSERSVLGWEVRRSTPDLALLGARSWIGMPAELLVKRQRQTLLFATFVQQDNRLARAAWAAIDRVHRPVVTSVLEHARRRTSATPHARADA
jgi:hypothetical protein